MFSDQSKGVSSGLSRGIQMVGGTGAGPSTLSAMMPVEAEPVSAERAIILLRERMSLTADRLSNQVKALVGAKSEAFGYAEEGDEVEPSFQQTVLGMAGALEYQASRLESVIARFGCATAS